MWVKTKKYKLFSILVKKFENLKDKGKCHKLKRLKMKKYFTRKIDISL